MQSEMCFSLGSSFKSILLKLLDLVCTVIKSIPVGSSTDRNVFFCLICLFV